MDCKRCSAIKQMVIDTYMAGTHHSWSARRRWRGHLKNHKRQLKLAGECTCGKNVTEDQAKSEIIPQLAPYGNFQS